MKICSINSTYFFPCITLFCNVLRFQDRSMQKLWYKILSIVLYSNRKKKKEKFFLIMYILYDDFGNT